MIEQKYSTFWPRFCAGFVDGLIFWPINWLLDFAYSHSASILFKVPIDIISSCAFLTYSIWMHGRFGQTLGKMACKVIVLDVSERPLSMRQAVLRDILNVVLVAIGLVVGIPRIIQGADINTSVNMTTLDYIIVYSSSGWFAIEVITMLTNNKRRALHDFIAGSVVVRKPEKANMPMALPTNSTTP